MKWIYGRQDWKTLERGFENCYLLTNAQETPSGGIPHPGAGSPDPLGGRRKLLSEVFYLSGCGRTLSVHHEK